MWPGWREELESNRWHWGKRWARTLPVVFIQPELRRGRCGCQPRAAACECRDSLGGGASVRSRIAAERWTAAERANRRAYAVARARAAAVLVLQPLAGSTVHDAAGGRPDISCAPKTISILTTYQKAGWRLPGTRSRRATSSSVAARVSLAALPLTRGAKISLLCPMVASIRSTVVAAAPSGEWPVLLQTGSGQIVDWPSSPGT